MLVSGVFFSGESLFCGTVVIVAPSSSDASGLAVVVVGRVRLMVL